MPRRLLALVLLSLALLSLSSCLQLGLPGDTAGAAGAAAGPSGSAGALATVTGAHCGADPSSGVALCLGISSCPDASVDPDQLPDCGYRVSGPALDIECVCGDYLCPIGPPKSCADAKALLADQSMLGACAAASDGRCTALPSKPKATTSSTCDAGCRNDCDGQPDCLIACGC